MTNAMLAKTSRHIEYFFISVGIWDTTAMLAKTDRQVLQERLKGFVMTKPVLAKSERHSRQVR